MTLNFDPAHPLDRCEGETRPAHDALLDYYRMGSGRSLRSLLAKYRNQNGIEAVSQADSFLGKPPTRRFGTLFQWSAENDWQARIQAQSEIDLEDERRVKAEALRAKAEEWAERRLAIREKDWEQGEQLRKLVDEAIALAPKFLKSTRKYLPGKNGLPGKEITTVALAFNDTLKALELSSKIQRLAAEMETDHTLTENTTPENIEEIRKKRWESIKDALADALSTPDDEDEVVTETKGDESQERADGK